MPQYTYIDCTPTWQSVLPMLIEGVRLGSDNCAKELENMAKVADEYNKLVKK